MIKWLRNLLENPYDPLFELWVKTKDSVIIEYPIMSYDTLTLDIIIKQSKEEVYSDSDFREWKWNQNERLIDSNGNVFKPIYEVRGNWPPARYPGVVEGKMEIDDFRGMIINVLKTQRFGPFLFKLIEQVESEKSIKEILEKLKYEF